MGFWIMIFSAVLGIALIALGTTKVQHNKIWIASIVIGICSFAFAVWLALPH